MSKLRIPKSHAEGFVFLSNLSESDFKELVNTISKIDRGTLPDKLASDISEETKIENDVSNEIAKILFNIYSLKEQFDNNISELTSELSLALKNSNVEIGTDSNWNKLEERLENLLSFDENIGNTFKALKLLSEYDKIFVNSKIVTDIRPAFDNENLSTDTALIVHNLKIGY
jgi:predicted amidohydrolase